MDMAGRRLRRPEESLAVLKYTSPPSSRTEPKCTLLPENLAPTIGDLALRERRYVKGDLPAGERRITEVDVSAGAEPKKLTALPERTASLKRTLCSLNSPI